MKDVFYYEMNGQKCEYHILEEISFSSLLTAINSAVDMCYTEDGVFRPELQDFATEYVILDTLTDIDMPDNADEAYKYIRAIDGVPSADADFIADGVRERIKYDTRLTVAAAQASGMNRMADMAEDVVMKVNQLLDGVNNMLDSVGKQVETGELSSVQNLLNALSSVKGVSNEDLVAGMLAYSKAQKAKPAQKKAVKSSK